MNNVKFHGIYLQMHDVILSTWITYNIYCVFKKTKINTIKKICQFRKHISIKSVLSFDKISFIL